MGVNFRDLATIKWFAVLDDTVGGWAIANVNKPVSAHDPSKGEFSIGDFLDEPLARYIVAMHNYRLGV